MLQPKRTKFRKQMKGRNTGDATTGNKFSFGEIGIKATSRGRRTARPTCLPAARVVVTSLSVARRGPWISCRPTGPAQDGRPGGHVELQPFHVGDDSLDIRPQ